MGFTYPRLHTGKSWYVDFTSFDPATGTMRRKKYMLDSVKDIIRFSQRIKSYHPTNLIKPYTLTDLDRVAPSSVAGWRGGFCSDIPGWDEAKVNDLLFVNIRCRNSAKTAEIGRGMAEVFWEFRIFADALRRSAPRKFLVRLPGRASINPHSTTNDRYQTTRRAAIRDMENRQRSARRG